MTNELTISDIAKQLGVSKPVMITARPYLAGFPRSRRANNKMNYFSAAGFKKWLNGRDVADVAQMIRDVYANARHVRNKENNRKRSSGLSQGDARAFLSGAYLPAEQREKLEFKKLVARTTKPKTTTVTVVSDWMAD